MFGKGKLCIFSVTTLESTASTSEDEQPTFDVLNATLTENASTKFEEVSPVEYIIPTAYESDIVDEEIAQCIAKATAVSLNKEKPEYVPQSICSGLDNVTTISLGSKPSSVASRGVTPNPPTPPASVPGALRVDVQALLPGKKKQTVSETKNECMLDIFD